MTRIIEILETAKSLATEYYALTGKPLGVTGEMGEYAAAKALGLDLSVARQAGYDAIGQDGRTIQIKGRVIQGKQSMAGRVGSIDIEKEFDTVMLVLMDPDFSAFKIYEADRQTIIDTLTAPGSKARNERGSLGIKKFISIGRLAWQR